MNEIKAASRFKALIADRATVLDKARRASDLTIAGLIPHEGQNDSTILQTPYQSLGARGINNLSSKLMLASFPPGSPFFRYNIDEDVLAENKDEGRQKKVLDALAKTERKASTMAERERPTLSNLMTHLLVAGNALYYMPKKENARLYALDEFVIRRRKDGSPSEVIICEDIHVSTLDEETRIKAKLTDTADQKPVKAYTVIEWKDKTVYWHQEINGESVTEIMSTPEEVSPWIPARWKARAGKDYGEGLAMEILGDLISYEQLSRSMVDFAEVAAKIIFLDHPNSTTDIDELASANSGDFVTGDISDIDVLQLEKYADFQVVNTVMERLERRLAEAFMLTSASIRNAERVTAEEIRAIAQELEDGLGGAYTILTSEFQLPYTRRLLHVMKQRGEAPALPSKAVKPVIVTGFDALGRAHSNNRIRALISDVKGLLGEEAVKSFKREPVIRRLGIGYGVEELEELLKTDEEAAAENQQEQAANAMQQATPAVAQEAAKAALSEEQPQ